MKIVIVGTGYVGLVTGACLADMGNHVTCIDIDADKVRTLEAGSVPFFEPGLNELVQRASAIGRLNFSSKLADHVGDAELVLLAVGTPSREGDGLTDLSFVFQAAHEVAAALDGPTTIVTKSTVPVGTGDEIERIVREARPNAKVSVVSNPEFLREGAAINDFMQPDRIVYGADDDLGSKTMKTLYAPFAEKGVPILPMTRRASELTKYAANAFLSIKLTFINEIADLCEKVGADVRDVADGIGHDKRIGRSFLNAGPGYGGSCFPKDTLALVGTALDYDSPVRTVETIVTLNDQRKRAMARKVVSACGGSVRGKKIGVLGLTFKAQTDDMREAPSIAIIKALQDFGAEVQAYDPMGMKAANTLFNNVQLADNPYRVAEHAHGLVIITEWAEFADLDLKQISASMLTPVLVDLRNIVDDKKARAAGITYHGVGRAFEGE